MGLALAKLVAVTHHHHDPVHYGRGFLIGRIDAYRRGTMSLAHVAGAVTLAKRFGVDDSHIAELLRASGLVWDRAREVVTAPSAEAVAPRQG